MVFIHVCKMFLFLFTFSNQIRKNSFFGKTKVLKRSNKSFNNYYLYDYFCKSRDSVHQNCQILIFQNSESKKVPFSLLEFFYRSSIFCEIYTVCCPYFQLNIYCISYTVYDIHHDFLRYDVILDNKFLASIYLNIAA